MAQAAVESFYREYASSTKTHDTCLLRGEVRPGRPLPLDNAAALPAGAGDIPRPGSQGHPGLRTGVPCSARGCDFDRQLVETDEQYVDLIRTRLCHLYKLWKRRSQYGTLVRYEDLVCSPTEQIRAMLDALELDSSANIVDSMVKAGNEATANVNSHQTSPDAASSIGRWKRDLEPRLQKICDEAFDGLLDELGYSSPTRRAGRGHGRQRRPSAGGISPCLIAALPFESVAADTAVAERSLASTLWRINMESAEILDAYFALATSYQDLFARIPQARHQSEF